MLQGKQVEHMIALLPSPSPRREMPDEQDRGKEKLSYQGSRSNTQFMSSPMLEMRMLIKVNMLR